MNSVTSVTPLPAGRVFVEMADGRCGEFDVKPYMGSDFFRPLMDAQYFNQVRLVFKGIGWPDGQDLGPDTIADQMVDVATTA